MRIVRIEIASTTPLWSLPHIDDIANRDLILEQDEETGNNVSDERLAAKADRYPDDPGASEERSDIDTEMRQDHQRGHDDDHAQQSGPHERKQ